LDILFLLLNLTVHVVETEMFYMNILSAFDLINPFALKTGSDSSKKKAPFREFRGEQVLRESDELLNYRSYFF